MKQSTNRQIASALKNWDKANDKAIVRAYLSGIGIDPEIYHKFVGREVRGAMLKFKVGGEYVAKQAILHKLGETCVLRIPLDPKIQKKKGRTLQGKLHKNTALYLGDSGTKLGIVKDLESALSLMSLREFSDFQFAVCGTAGNFEKYTPTGKHERIVVFADDDFQTQKPLNPGLTSALNLVKRLNKETKTDAELCRPKRYEKIMRWNDLLKQELLEDSLKWGWEVEFYPEGPNIAEFLDQVEGRKFGSIKISESVIWQVESNGKTTEISNFIPYPEATIINHNGNESIDCTLIHAQGYTKHILFTVEDLNEQSKFALRCKTKGRWGFIWSGKGNNFHSMLLFLNSMCQGKPNMKLVDYWGCTGKVYFYSNAAISKDEIVEIKDRKIGIAGEDYLMQRNKEMPYGKVIQTVYRKGICNEAKVEEAFRYIKGNGEAMLALGFGIGTMYMDHVVEEFGAFPFLGLFGYRGSAKNTLARMVMAMFGFKMMLPPITFSGSTEAGISQGMEVLGSVPYWIDEYNGGILSRINEEFLKAIYGQASTAIGSLEGAKTRAVKSSLILSGQVMSVDAALRTRIVTVRLSRAALRKDVISWVFDNREQFNFYGRLKIQQSLDQENQHAYVEKIREVMEDLAAQGIDHRIAVNYAVALAAVDLFTGLDAARLKRLILPILVEFEEEMEALDPVNTFFNELLSLYIINRQDEKTKKIIMESIGISDDKKEIYIRLQVLHSLLVSHKIEIDKLTDLRSNLVAEHAAEKGQHKTGGKFHRGAYAIPVKHASDYMKEAVAEILGKPKLFDTNDLRIV